MHTITLHLLNALIKHIEVVIATMAIHHYGLIEMSIITRN